MRKIVLQLVMSYLIALSWTQSFSMEQQSSKNAPGEIRITAKNATVVAGDPVYVSMQFENTSDHPIKFTVANMGGIDFRYSFHIATEGGTLLESIAESSIGSLGVLSIQ